GRLGKQRRIEPLVEALLARRQLRALCGERSRIGKVDRVTVRLGHAAREDPVAESVVQKRRHVRAEVLPLSNGQIPGPYHRQTLWDVKRSQSMIERGLRLVVRIEELWVEKL